MKNRLCALILALCLPLSGCGSLFHRSYSSVERYTQTQTAPQDPSVLTAATYQELLSAILFFVAQHAESGTVRLYNFPGEPDAALAQACLEVMRKDPLTAFCVKDIRHDVERIVSYYEVQLDFTYSRTQEEIDSIVSVTGGSAIKNEFRQALFTLEDCLLLKISYFSEETALEDLFAQAYYDTPLSAFGLPELSIQLYPDSGLQRIVEIGFLYPADTELLLQQQAELIQAVSALLPNGTPLAPEQLYDLLLEHVSYGSTGSTAYAALVDGTADDAGLAQAYKLLCDRIGLTCCVVCGHRADGSQRFWNIVTTPNGSRHVDCSADLFGLTDLQLSELGNYYWAGSYPICRDGNEISGISINS